jgi:hypothetical protein
MAKKLLHCEKIVSEISEGRWLAISSVTPYFLPSLATLSIAPNDARYFAAPSCGAYL